MKEVARRTWEFLKADTWQSWLVSLGLTFLFIKFIFFPGLSLLTGTALPLVVIESCSMYHATGFEGWWAQNGAWYETHGITREDYEKFPFKNGLNKGDIIFVLGSKPIKPGNIIIFNANYTYPLIHRIVTLTPLGTKGDNNVRQLEVEETIDPNQVIGRAWLRIPALGWVKLIFFEGFKSESQRGFCK